MMWIEELRLKPLTPETWADFENLFGSKGAYGGCWCMWWRIPRKEFEKGQGDQNKQAMKALVESGCRAGLIAYHQNQPCAWCSVAPRQEYATLQRSRVLKRLDEKPVWSIVCFFIDKKYRGQGLSEKLLRGVIEYVRQNGGKIIEAYPPRERGKPLAPVSSFMGIEHIYRRVGFKEVQRPSPSKLIMRYFIE